MNGHPSDYFFNPDAGVESGKATGRPDQSLSFSIDRILGLKSDVPSIPRASSSASTYGSDTSGDHNFFDRFRHPSPIAPFVSELPSDHEFDIRAQDSLTEVEQHSPASGVSRCGFEACEYPCRLRKSRSPFFHSRAESRSCSNEDPRFHSRSGERTYLAPTSLVDCNAGYRCKVGPYAVSTVDETTDDYSSECADTHRDSPQSSRDCTCGAAARKSPKAKSPKSAVVESKTPVTLESIIAAASNRVCPVTCRGIDFNAATDKDVCPMGRMTMQLLGDKYKGRRIGHPYQSRAPPKRKPARHSFTTSQVAQLEKLFEKSKYLSSSERQRVATQLNMTDSQLKTWYQNRRTKLKREIAEMQERQHRVRETIIGSSLSR